ELGPLPVAADGEGLLFVRLPPEAGDPPLLRDVVVQPGPQLPAEHGVVVHHGVHHSTFSACRRATSSSLIPSRSRMTATVCSPIVGLTRWTGSTPSIR